MTSQSPTPVLRTPDSDSGGGQRIMVVDSDPETRELCRRVLQARGYSVDMLGSGVAALTAARQNPPVLILLDLQLSDVDGMQFVAWLRSDPTLQSIPVIPISATAEDAARLPPAKLGLLLRKPLSATAITRAVRQIMQAAV